MKILTKSNKAILVGGKAIKDNGLTDGTKSLVAAITGVTPTDELSLNNAIAEGSTNGASEHSWADTRTTAGGGTITDGVAYVDKVKGKSIKVSQRNSYGDFANSTSWKANGNATISIANNEATVTLTSDATSNYHGYIGLSSSLSITIGHKYLVCVLVNPPKSGNLRIDTNSAISTSSTAITASTWTAAYAIGTATKTNMAISLYPNERNDGYVAGDAYKVKRCMVFDLTEMGIDNLTTADAVAQYLGYADAASMPYIPYTPSTTILHSQHSGIVSKDEDGQTLDTLALPSLVLRGVGTAADEYTPSTGKVTRKIASVDLGSLPWRYSDGFGYVPSSSFKLPTTNSMPSNSYRFYDRDQDARNNKPCFQRLENTGALRVWNDDWQSADAIIAGLSGVILYYELATPTETSTEQQTPQRAYYKVSNNGQETANAVGQSAPFVADLGYKEATATQLMNVLTQ